MSPSNRTATKTDNASLPKKLELRRYVLGKACFPELRVLDLCAGAGHIWRALREEYPVASYTPCDQKPRLPGCIKGEAARLIDAFDLSRFNVIDIDTYGEPWECWLKAASRIRTPTVVFMTFGTASARGGFNTSAAARAALGIPATWPVLPQKLELALFAADYCLAKGAELCAVIAAAKTKLPNVTYYGLVCGPNFP